MPSPPPLSTTDSELRRLVYEERFRIMMRMTTSGTIGSAVFALIFAAAMRPVATAGFLSCWLGLKLTVAAARLAHGHAFRRRGLPASPRWRAEALALLLLDGAVWGLAGVWLQQSGDPRAESLLVVGLMGVATAATFTLHSHWLANAFYGIAIVLPMALSFLGRQDVGAIQTGSGLLLFMACLLTLAWRAQRQVMEMLRLRFVNAHIAQEREAALALAQQRHEVQSRFVATMSHELRTPLHGILGLARLMRGAPLDAANQARAGLVEKAGEHLLSIINDILDFSRMEAGHLAVERQAFDLAALLDDLLALTQVSAHAKGLALLAEFSLPRPCVVEGDAARVGQVLLNLLGNAVKFTEHGHVRLTAAPAPGDGEAAGLVVLRVEDTGVGIEAADLAHIFEPFHRAARSMGNAAGGTGLGLAICRELVRAMQGDITCTSTPGRGSCFVVTLPLPVSSQAIPRPAPSPWPSPRPAPAAAGLRGHVLLAEDNDVNAMVVEALLKRLGLTVEHVADGAAALQRVCGGGPRPDLVLMDCHMPAMDGFEATRQIRADEAQRGLGRLPVVALTASALAEDTRRCLGAGMDAHLPKPFDEDALLRVLHAHLPTLATA